MQDDVIQQENTHDFTRGNWTTLYLSPAGFETVIEPQGNRFDRLSGRHTYDLRVDYWFKAGNRLTAKGSPVSLSVSTGWARTWSLNSELGLK